MTVLLEGAGLVRRYPARDRRSSATHVVVDHVDLALEAGDALGIVGASGAGKSSLARLLLGLETPDAGRVLVAGEPYDAGPLLARRARRRRVQAVFQDPFASLNPRLRVGLAIAEPMLAHGLIPPAGLASRVAEILGQVGLEPGLAERFPGSLSGGERQRVAIARALSCDPDLVVLDEPVSALDAVHRRGVVELIESLRVRRALALVLISHDLETVERVCGRIAVMERGRIVESGSVEEVIRDPRHAATRALIEAARAMPRPC